MSGTLKDIGLHSNVVKPEKPILERIDLYGGVIVLKARLPTIVEKNGQGIAADDLAWHRVKLPSNLVAISATRQPNMHTHIVSRDMALNGTWQYIRPTDFTVRSLEGLGCVVGEMLVKDDPLLEEICLTRYGCIATVLNPVILEYPLSWIIGTHDIKSLRHCGTSSRALQRA